MKHESTKLIELLNDINVEYENAFARYVSVENAVARDLQAFEEEVLTEYAMSTSYIDDLMYEDDENVRIDANTYFHARHIRDAYYDALRSLVIMRYNEIQRRLRGC